MFYYSFEFHFELQTSLAFFVISNEITCNLVVGTMSSKMGVKPVNWVKTISLNSEPSTGVNVVTRFHLSQNWANIPTFLWNRWISWLFSWKTGLEFYLIPASFILSLTGHKCYSFLIEDQNLVKTSLCYFGSSQSPQSQLCILIPAFWWC